jgi:hypothetical protein
VEHADQLDTVLDRAEEQQVVLEATHRVHAQVAQGRVRPRARGADPRRGQERFERSLGRLDEADGHRLAGMSDVPGGLVDQVLERGPTTDDAAAHASEGVTPARRCASARM